MIFSGVGATGGMLLLVTLKESSVSRLRGNKYCDLGQQRGDIKGTKSLPRGLLRSLQSLVFRRLDSVFNSGDVFVRLHLKSLELTCDMCFFFFFAWLRLSWEKESVCHMLDEV